MAVDGINGFGALNVTFQDFYRDPDIDFVPS